MKRARKPPAQEVVEDALVIADAIAVGRRKEPEIAALITKLCEVAGPEYLRRFPQTRKQNVDLWVEMPLLNDGSVNYEIDYQCFFCRKSLNTLPRFKQPNRAFTQQLEIHVEECAVRMLAGLMTPHKPLKHGAPGL